jgi:hypothetical protein
MREITLTKGQTSIVDDEDFERLNQYSWHAQWNSTLKAFYASRRVVVNGRGTAQSLHRFILGLEPGDKRTGDHLNHNTLDNRKYNLVIATHRENNRNRKNKSKYGYCISYSAAHRSKPFKVSMWLGDKNTYIGRYATHEEAERARDAVQLAAK